jgi:hypothetical protein
MLAAVVGVPLTVLVEMVLEAAVKVVGVTVATG